MFSRLTREQARRRWFPKFTLTVLEPVRLTVDDELKGKARRMAAGAALYQIMSDLVFRTTKTDRTLFEAVVRRGATSMACRASRSKTRSRGALTYRQLLIGARALGGEVARLGAAGRSGRRHAAQRQCARASTFLAVSSAGRVPAMINFTAGATNILSGCEAARVNDDRHVARLHREGQARQARRARSARKSRSSISKTCARASTRSTSCARCAPFKKPARSRARPTTWRRCSSPRARKARPRASRSRTGTCWPTPRRRRRASTSAATTRCSTCCRCFTASA